MGPIVSYFFGSMGLAFIAVRILEWMFEPLLHPFRLLRRRTPGFRRNVDGSNR